VIQQARSGAISMKEARERINELIKEYAISYEQIVSQADPKTQKAVKERIDRVIEDTKRGTRDLHRDRAHPVRRPRRAGRVEDPHRLQRSW
jgi:hypothetical protein